MKIIEIIVGASECWIAHCLLLNKQGTFSNFNVS